MSAASIVPKLGGDVHDVLESERAMVCGGSISSMPLAKLSGAGFPRERPSGSSGAASMRSTLATWTPLSVIQEWDSATRALQGRDGAQFLAWEQTQGVVEGGRKETFCFTMMTSHETAEKRWRLRLYPSSRNAGAHLLVRLEGASSHEAKLEGVAWGAKEGWRQGRRASILKSHLLEGCNSTCLSPPARALSQQR